MDTKRLAVRVRVPVAWMELAAGKDSYADVKLTVFFLQFDLSEQNSELKQPEQLEQPEQLKQRELKFPNLNWYSVHLLTIPL
ncbi:MAG: hypothetical protein MJY74_06545 [Bacteroidaceae bacterium]|nr:hypothetical protein [Bacteroidaceae bacterium]